MFIAKDVKIIFKKINIYFQRHIIYTNGCIAYSSGSGAFQILRNASVTFSLFVHEASLG